MIDSGTTHNFILDKLVSQLQIVVEITLAFRVKLGDGHRVEFSRLCCNIHMDLGQIEMSAYFFVFPLGSVDLISGMAWLKTLGSMQIN